MGDIRGVVILLGIFGSGILTYRSMFLQVKESGYIDAARAYGESSGRIILRYMIPKVIPVLIPQFVASAQLCDPRSNAGSSGLG